MPGRKLADHIYEDDPPNRSFVRVVTLNYGVIINPDLDQMDLTIDLEDAEFLSALFAEAANQLRKLQRRK